MTEKEQKHVLSVGSRHAFLVLGMHRSGTSALTNLLQSWGASGPKTPLKATKDNARGYGESKKVMMLNDDFLSRLGTSWDDWRSIQYPIESDYLVDDFKAALTETISDEFGSEAVIVLKDPRICKMAGLWIEALSKMDFGVIPVLIFRNPLEVARSLLKRNEMDLTEGLLLWLRHVLEMERSTRGYERAVIDYADLVGQPEFVADTLGALQGRIAVDLLNVSAENNTIDKNLKHHFISPEYLRKDKDVFAWARDAFAALLNLKQNKKLPEAYDALDCIYEELGRSEAVFSKILNLKKEAFQNVQRNLDQKISQISELEKTRDQNIAEISKVETLLKITQEKLKQDELSYKQELAARCKENAEYERLIAQGNSKISKLENSLKVLEKSGIEHKKRLDEAQEVIAKKLSVIEQKSAEIAKLDKVIEEEKSIKASFQSELEKQKADRIAEGLEYEKQLAQLKQANSHNLLIINREKNALASKLKVNLEQHNIIQEENSKLRVEKNNLDVAAQNYKRRLVTILDEQSKRRPIKRHTTDKMLTRLILKSDLFDFDYYKSQFKNKDLDTLRSAIGHYLRIGSALGYNPHPLFDNNWYLSEYSDVVDSGRNPLVHYIRHGAKEGRNPHSLFSTSWYMQKNPDVAAGKINPLTHFVRYGAFEGRDPHPQFSLKYYLSANEDVAQSKTNGLIHYLRYGHSEGRNPNANFDQSWYQSTYKDLIPRDCSALEYHVLEGAAKNCEAFPGENLNPKLRSRQKSGVKNILVVAHSASERFFGAERSLLDVLRVINTEKYRIILALPSPNISYVNIAKPHVDKIISYKMDWWTKAKAKRPDNITFFKDVIQSENIDLVYVNTIMLDTPLHAAKELKVPSVTHIRELIDRDKKLVEMIGLPPKEIVKQVGARSDYLIANSVVVDDLFSKHGDTTLIPNAINVDDFDFPNSLADNGILNVGMLSSNITKKGIDDFFELAKLAEKKLLPIQFLAYGPETADTKRLKKHIAANNGPHNITFPGYVSDVATAVKKLNVVVNLSRFAESFGRTAVEAMAAHRPIIGYDHGALPDVISHDETGYIIPYLKPEAALPYLENFIENPHLLQQMGQKGRVRVIQKFSYDVLSKNIEGIFHKALSSGKTSAKQKDINTLTEKNSIDVSVVVPNYNYAHYLEERLKSIFDQSHLPSEIIFLDDCSSDNSLKVAKTLLEDNFQNGNKIPYRIIPNKKNAGVYKQWLKGIKKAKHEWVWIAEADDTSHPDFLKSLISTIDDDVNLAYCQSRKIDEHGKEISANNFAHTNDIDTEKWKSDYKINGQEEVCSSLVYRNIIPNTSSAIFRKSAARGVDKEILTYRYAGDWFFYSYLLRQGNLSYVAAALNNFRRHDGGVTRQQSHTSDYLLELLRIRKYIAQTYPILPRQIQRMDEFLNRDYKISRVKKNTNYSKGQKLLNEVENVIEPRKRIAIITTNNGSYNGGSEMLWQESAIKLAKDSDHDVIVLIKQWSPEPDLFAKLRQAGVKILFKGEGGFNELLDLNPDLTIVSIGDQDEGIEYYPELTANKIPYVIINQLTKEVRFWPLREKKLKAVTQGYLGARSVFFTCQNNHRVMEDRLGVKLENGDQHFNPYHIDRDYVPPYPTTKNGYHLAVPSKLLFIHKGQDLIIDIAREEKWRNRDAHFNFYGNGPDRAKLEALIAEFDLKNCHIRGRVGNIGDIWKENHALLMPSRMEGLPIMMVSALLSARLCIATDIGGHAEVIADGKSGFIIKNPEATDVDAALEKAYSERKNWKAMGTYGRETILNFLPEDPVENFIGQLESIWGGVKES